MGRRDGAAGRRRAEPPEAGQNYGWPVVSWGINYDGSEIPDPPTRPEFADARTTGAPVISPSGMAFYTGDVFSAWSGSVFIGGLSRQGLVRAGDRGRRGDGRGALPLGTRIRDVEQGPDGLLYVLTDKDDGEVWRLAPLMPNDPLRVRPAGGLRRRPFARRAGGALLNRPTRYDGGADGAGGGRHGLAVRTRQGAGAPLALAVRSGPGGARDGPRHSLDALGARRARPVGLGPRQHADSASA